MYTITKEEYNNLITRLQFYDTARNKLLVFSFTAVMTILGVSLQITMNTVSVYICLIPYLLIIPFSARIVYYPLQLRRLELFSVFVHKNIHNLVLAQKLFEKIAQKCILQ